VKEIIITNNEAEQRIDRFLRKYLAKASLSFIYKQIRKKNIVVNDSKVDERYILKLGDNIKLYFSDETIEKLKSDPRKILSHSKLDIIYEDENIILINKPAGVLSHSAKGNYKEDNIVDSMLSYLIKKGDFVPRLSKTFTPSIANRLDRNTSGILIGGKNYETIQELNTAQRSSSIKKYYYTLVSGKIEGSSTEYATINKVNNHENLVRVSKEENSYTKDIITAYKSIITSDKYSLLEIDLITGRTHQIRAHLSFLKMPVIGDRKYGLRQANDYFKKKYNLNNQLLHCYKIVFDDLGRHLEYLNKQTFIANNPVILDKIIEGEFHGKN
jgi:23S rRNA pseudouridine955/2504/2580 synthase